MRRWKKRLSLLAVVAAVWTGGAPADAQESEEGVSVEALALILKAEDVRASELLGDSANSPNPALRARTALAFGRIGLPRDSARLISYLKEDDSAAVRAAAAFALGEMLDRATLEEIGATPDLAPATEALLEALGRDGEIAVRAAEALGKMKADSAATPLAAKLAHLRGELSPDQLFFAETLAEALIRLESDRAFGTLRQLAQSPYPSLRAAAAGAIRRLKDREGRSVLLTLLQDADPAVRASAARALGTVGDATEDVPALAGALADEAWNVRIEAARGLSGLKSPQAGAALRPRFEELRAACLADDGEKWVAENGLDANELVVIIDALGEVSADPAVLEALDGLRALDNIVGYRALVAFASAANRLGQPERLLEFPEGYRSRGYPAIQHLALALGEAPSTDSLKLVSQMFNAADAPARASANLMLARPDLAGALAAHGEILGNADEALARMLTLSDVYVRAEAASLLVPEEGAVEGKWIDSLAKAFAQDGGVLPDARLAILDAIAPRLAYIDTQKTLKAALEDPSRLVRARAVKLLGRGNDENLAALLGRRRSLRLELAPQKSEIEFYREIAEMALERRVFARIEVAGRGAFALELFAEDAPLTVANFAALARQGFFVELAFHRVVPNFVIQGGDPRRDCRGGPAYVIPCEINARRFQRGTLGMALSGKDTGGSQFFVSHGAEPRLDGGYTAFGRIVERPEEIAGLEEAVGETGNGYDFIDKIKQYDVVSDIKIFETSR